MGQGIFHEEDWVTIRKKIESASLLSDHMYPPTFKHHDFN